MDRVYNHRAFGSMLLERPMVTAPMRFKVTLDGVLVARCSTRASAEKLKSILEDVSEGFYARHARNSESTGELEPATAPGDEPLTPLEIEGPVSEACGE